jgi:cobalamin synthase
LAWLAAWRVDLAAALTFLTRLPLPEAVTEPDRPPDLARATRAMPLAGAAIGLGGGAVYWLSAGLGLTPAIAGLLAVAATILVTGALHEDGLADSADGLFAGAESARRLEIMRDSRIGAYGTLALGETNYGLVQTSDGLIHRVVPGNYLGQNDGRIVVVEESEIQLVEIISDGIGGYLEREAAVGLAD